MAVVQQACEFLTLRVMSLHGRFEQGLLNVARQVAPHFQGGPSQQIGEPFFSVANVHPPSDCIERELRAARGVPSPSLRKEAR